MAGPSKVNVGTVINPFTEAQNALRNVVDTRTQAKKENRESQIFQEESDERDLARHNRELLKTYDPQLGVRGKGLSGDALDEYNTRVSQEVKKYQGLADKGEEVPTPEEMVKRFNTIGKSLVTKEDARKAVMDDLIRKGIAPEKSTAYADLYTSDLTSREELKAYETASVAAQNTAYEAQQNAAEKAIKANTDRYNSNRLTAAEYKASNFGGSTRPSSSKNSSGDGWSLSSMGETVTFLDDAIGTGDSARTVAAMNNAMLSTNAERRKLGMQPINYRDVQMLVAAKKGASDSWFDNQSGYEGEKGAATLQEDLTTLFKSDYEEERNRRSAGGYSNTSSLRSAQPINPVLMRSMLNTQRAAPRSMSAIDRERVARAFGDIEESKPATRTPVTSKDVLATTLAGSRTTSKTGAADPASGSGKMNMEEAQAIVDNLNKLRGGKEEKEVAETGQTTTENLEAAVPELPERAQAAQALAQAVFDANQGIKTSTYRLQSIGRTVPAESEEAAKIRQQHREAVLRKEAAEAEAEEGRKAYGMDGFWSSGEYNRIYKGIEDADNKRRIAAAHAEGATNRRINQDNRFYREGTERLSDLSNTLKGSPLDAIRRYSESEIRDLATRMSGILERRESGY